MLKAKVNDKKEYQIEQVHGEWQLNSTPIKWDIKKLPNGLISILYNDFSYTASVESINTSTKELSIKISGEVYHIAIKEPIDQLLSSMGMDLKSMQKVEPVKAPMPGLVLKILVAPGQQINKGDGLLVLEAMKMENILKATGPATVKAIKVTEKTAVEKGAILIDLE